MNTEAKTSRRKRKTKTNALGRKLLESARQALHEASSCNMSGVKTRTVKASKQR